MTAVPFIEGLSYKLKDGGQVATLVVRTKTSGLFRFDELKPVYHAIIPIDRACREFELVPGRQS